MLSLNVCPFCGEEAELSKDEYGRYNVFCTGSQCGAVMVGFKNRQQVADAWNTRINKLPSQVVLPINKSSEEKCKYHDVCTIREMTNRLNTENIAISENAIRCLVKSGQIPSVKVGAKFLVSYRNMLEFIEKGN